MHCNHSSWIVGDQDGIRFRNVREVWKQVCGTERFHLFYYMVPNLLLPHTGHAIRFDRLRFNEGSSGSHHNELFNFGTTYSKKKGSLNALITGTKSK
jgi:hypothetical protein